MPTRVPPGTVLTPSQAKVLPVQLQDDWTVHSDWMVEQSNRDLRNRNIRPVMFSDISVLTMRRITRDLRGAEVSARCKDLASNMELNAL